jgi:uncharacterized protein YjiS (DUF1127 family)
MAYIGIVAVQHVGRNSEARGWKRRSYAEFDMSSYTNPEARLSTEYTHQPVAATLAGLVAVARQQIITWALRARDRHDLAKLSERELLDMPFSRSAALAEARKPFWRA